MMPTEPMMPGETFVPQPRMPRPLDFKPEEVFPSGHRWEGKPRCHAWSGRNGHQCNRMPMKWMTVCRSHGGAGGRPPKHGKYSGTARFHAAYRRAAGNPKAFDLKPEIALIESRIHQNLDELEKTGGIVDPAEIRKAAAMIQRGLERADLELCKTGLALLVSACKKEKTRNTLRRRLGKDIEAERRLVDTERRWQTLNKQMVPGEEVAELGRQMVLIFCKHETDPKIRAAIAKDIRALFPRTN